MRRSQTSDCKQTYRMSNKTSSLNLHLTFSQAIQVYVNKEAENIDTQMRLPISLSPVLLKPSQVMAESKIIWERSDRDEATSKVSRYLLSFLDMVPKGLFTQLL